MKRFAVYRDISPTYVLFDRLTEEVAALFVNQRDAERAAERLNDQPPRLPYRALRAFARTVPRPTPRYAVQPGFHDFERVVVDQWTEKIIWGPRRDMHAAERTAATLNKNATTDDMR